MTHANDHEPIHAWFELTYSSYLVLQRTFLQSMPVTWQRAFVRLIEEMDEAFDDLPDLPSGYKVLAVDSSGKFTSDPYRDYQRGRRHVKPLNEKPAEAPDGKCCWGFTTKGNLLVFGVGESLVGYRFSEIHLHIPTSRFDGRVAEWISCVVWPCRENPDTPVYIEVKP